MSKVGKNQGSSNMTGFSPLQSRSLNPGSFVYEATTYSAVWIMCFYHISISFDDDTTMKDI